MRDSGNGLALGKLAGTSSFTLIFTLFFFFGFVREFLVCNFFFVVLQVWERFACFPLIRPF